VCGGARPAWPDTGLVAGCSDFQARNKRHSPRHSPARLSRTATRLSQEGRRMRRERNPPVYRRLGRRRGGGVPGGPGGRSRPLSVATPGTPQIPTTSMRLIGWWATNATNNGQSPSGRGSDLGSGGVYEDLLPDAGLGTTTGAAGAAMVRRRCRRRPCRGAANSHGGNAEGGRRRGSRNLGDTPGLATARGSVLGHPTPPRASTAFLEACRVQSRLAIAPQPSPPAAARRLGCGAGVVRVFRDTRASRASAQ
jgi:hypothetical protein